MSKEPLDRIKNPRNAPLDTFFKITYKLFVVAVALLAIIIIAKMFFSVLNFERKLEMTTTTELIELDTTEKIDYITSVFHIKDTNNVGMYKVLFNEGCMSIIMDDIKDIHELYFENLAYYEMTEEDYNETIRTTEEYNELSNTLQDKHESGHYKSSKDKSNVRWLSSWVSPSENYWEMQFRDKNDNYFIFVRNADDNICCEVRTGWGKLEVLKELHSMN